MVSWAPKGLKTSHYENPEDNETILDGNIDTDGNDDCYHVVYIDAGAVDSTKLSGFTIQHGRADNVSDLDDKFGGGVFMKPFTTPGAAALDRLILRDNNAYAGGGGFYNRTMSSYVHIANCLFEYNEVTLHEDGLGGAALLQSDGKTRFVNCIFRENSCGGAGGAIASDSWSWIVNCTFYHNSAAPNEEEKTGGAVYSEYVEYVTLFNSIAWDNDDPQLDAPSPIENYLYVRYSDIQDGPWLTFDDTPATNTLDDPRFRDAVNGDFSLKFCSPAIDTGRETDGYLVSDTSDIDDDSDAGELMPWDTKKFKRVINYTNGSTPFLDMGAHEECPGDVDGNGTVELQDLTLLLGCFGMTDCGSNDPACCRADLAGDDCATSDTIELADLAVLLARFGLSCIPTLTLEPLTEEDTTITVVPLETGYAGGGFAGEFKHFVFDVIVELDTSADDWTGSGVTVTAANSATFRLVPNAGNPPTPGSGTPQKYTTFFSEPYGVDASNRFTNPLANGAIAGRYSGSGGYVYSSTSLNAAWYDLSSSNDGPAAVCRLVIEVSEVGGAYVGDGFGSVYFTTGSPGSGDIKVADMTFDLEHKYLDSASTVLVGSFYVTD